MTKDILWWSAPRVPPFWGIINLRYRLDRVFWEPRHKTAIVKHKVFQSHHQWHLLKEIQIQIHILFSGSPDTKLLWCSVRSSFHIRKAVHYLRYFFLGGEGGHNWISWANGQLLTIAGLTASESFWSDGSFELLGPVPPYRRRT